MEPLYATAEELAVSSNPDPLDPLQLLALEIRDLWVH